MLSITTKERIIAGVLSFLGAAALLSVWMESAPVQVEPGEILLAMLFLSAIILADRYPIHILRGTKVSLINLPIFLAVTLLPAPLAVFTVGVGLLTSNLLVRAERGLLPRDILATTGQWIIIAFLGSEIIHLTLPGWPGEVVRDGLLIVCAVVFILADFTISSITQSFIVGEPFSAMLKSLVKEGLPLELTQYFIAILGALAAYENIWSLVLLVIPIAITHVAFKNLKETRSGTIHVLQEMADMVDLRDVYTGGHAKRVEQIAHQILAHMNIAGPEATLIELAARLHDIGKIGIPDDILRKPDRLTNEEMAIMQTHSEKGAALISKYSDFSRGVQIIRHHHERWDGKGYPDRLKEYDIPFGARVIAVADGFDAMTSDRPYRAALSVTQALEILRNDQGKHWDPQVAGAFLELMEAQAVEDNRVPRQASLPVY